MTALSPELDLLFAMVNEVPPRSGARRSVAMVQFPHRSHTGAARRHAACPAGEPGARRRSPPTSASSATPSSRAATSASGWEWTPVVVPPPVDAAAGPPASEGAADPRRGPLLPRLALEEPARAARGVRRARRAGLAPGAGGRRRRSRLRRAASAAAADGPAGRAARRRSARRAARALLARRAVLARRRPRPGRPPPPRAARALRHHDGRGDGPRRRAAGLPGGRLRPRWWRTGAPASGGVRAGSELARADDERTCIEDEPRREQLGRRAARQEARALLARALPGRARHARLVLAPPTWLPDGRPRPAVATQRVRRHGLLDRHARARAAARGARATSPAAAAAPTPRRAGERRACLARSACHAQPAWRHATNGSQRQGNARATISSVLRSAHACTGRSGGAPEPSPACSATAGS